MAKFNKSELVNLAYSLKREILCSNKSGAYCNSSILTCNTRRYHGLLAVTLDRFGGDRYLLLSSVDESLLVSGKQFNLGIHCYGGNYDPKGHKYIVDFNASPLPEITYKVGDIMFRKTILLDPKKDQVLIKYELVKSEIPVQLMLSPYLAFRNIHSLTHQNSAAHLDGGKIPNGMSYQMYDNFPYLHLQLSDSKSVFKPKPNWNLNITYSDEYRRGFDCKEDLYVPGVFEMNLKPGESVVLSASLQQEDPKNLKRRFSSLSKAKSDDYRSTLVHCADSLIIDHNNVKKIQAGYSWLYSGLLRESLWSLPGLTLCGLNSAKLFEEILDNIIAAEPERLFHRTTQVEAPLLVFQALQKYLDFGAKEKTVWNKYGSTLIKILESYLPGSRAEVAMHPNGLLWAQKDGVALTWMNAYVDGYPVTERAGYQIETNAFWYNAVSFVVEMLNKFEPQKSEKWINIQSLIKLNFQKTFWNEKLGKLADYVGYRGQNLEVRPNQLWAVSLKYSPIDELLVPTIMRTIDSELITKRGVRTLSPRDPLYKGVYEGSQRDRDLAYHQGSAYPFLLAPYILTMLKLNGAAFTNKAEWLVKGFAEDLNKHGVGAFSELYDGDPPHEAHGAISSALSTAALLSIECELDKYRRTE